LTLNREETLKASVYIATSLDGFIAREDGELDWLVAEGADEGGEDFGFHAFLNSVDTLVMGRNTYELVLSSDQWPYGKKRVVVLSSHPVHVPSDLVESVESQNSSPAELVKQLSERGAKHLYIDGGRTIQGFLDAGLIQQIIITRIPVLIGKGIPLFGPLSTDINLEHVETTSFANGFVQSRYKVH
jgi:dihydrofolate reductase